MDEETKAMCGQNGQVSDQTATEVEPAVGFNRSGEELEDVQCGINKCCVPKALQRCASIGPFTANVSGLYFVNLAFFTYFLGTIRTLEKRFELSSTKSSFTLVMMDIMFALLSLLIGYMGRKAHKPRVMVTCQILTSVGIFILALPILLYGPRRLDTETTVGWASPSIDRMPSQAAINKMIGLCVSPEVSNISELSSVQPPDACVEESESAAAQSEESRRAYILLLSGSLLIGLGGVAVSTLGIPYIDENIASTDSACYIGVATSAYSWAPIIGLLLSALCTRIPETLYDDTGLKPSHPSYIGAWWLGMVILGGLSLALAMPMALFPKHLRHYYSTRGENRSGEPEQEDLCTSMKEYPRLTLKFLTNGPYMALLFSKICGLYGVTGVILQMPRYMEIHYRQPAYVANIIAAFSGGVVGALGTILGGFAMRRLKLKTWGIATMFTIATGCGMLGTALCMFYGCPQADLDGTWDAATKAFSIESSCSTSCGCSSSAFRPVCTEDQRTFFSPCHAGCQEAVLKNDTYLGCECIGEDANTTGGYCSSETCQTIVPYIMTILIVSFLVAFGRVPATVLMFRLVDEKEKAPIMGLTSFFVNILCFVPAPILFGVLFDSACMVWKSSCSSTGACLFYDIRKFRLLMHGVTLGFQIPSFIFALITLYLVRRKMKANVESKEGVAMSNMPALLVGYKTNGQEQ